MSTAIDRPTSVLAAITLTGDLGGAAPLIGESRTPLALPSRSL